MESLYSIQILNETMCDVYLNHSVRNHPNVTVRPNILCVGKFMKWNVDPWYHYDENYLHIKKKALKDTLLGFFHYGAKYGLDGYVTSAGTCKGDSGGPLYVQIEGGRQGR